MPQSLYLQNGADNPCPTPNKMLVEGNALKTFKLLLLSREGATSPTQISSDRRKSEKSKASENWETKVIDFLLEELQKLNRFLN